MLDEATYNLLMEVLEAIFGAARAARRRAEEQIDAPLPMQQLRAGYAESPGWFLVQAAEFAPEPLTVANLRVRDVYGAPRIVQALLDLMASERWLEHDDHGAYHLAQAGFALLEGARLRRQDLLARLAPLSGADVDRLAELLDRLITASLESPTPPGTWCLAHSRRRAPTADAPVLVHIAQYCEDFNAFRDDAHMAAWRPKDIEGYAWEAFACIYRGEARTVDEVFERLAHRGYTRTEYAAALADLSARDWLEPDGESGAYRVCAAGRAVYEEVEQSTDRYFYAPWSSLSTEETSKVLDLLARLRDNLHTLSN